MHAILSEAAQLNFDSEAYYIAKAAKIVKNDILKQKRVAFEGSFNRSLIENSVPPSLLQFLRMILGISSIAE